MNWEEHKAFRDSIPPCSIPKFLIDLLIDLYEAHCDLLTPDDIREFCKIAKESDANKLNTLGNTGAKWTLKLDNSKVDYQDKMAQKEKEFIAHIQKKLLKAKEKQK